MNKISHVINGHLSVRSHEISLISHNGMPVRSILIGWKLTSVKVLVLPSQARLNQARLNQAIVFTDSGIEELVGNYLFFPDEEDQNNGDLYENKVFKTYKLTSVQFSYVLE